jgi:hypothetical protein
LEGVAFNNMFFSDFRGSCTHIVCLSVCFTFQIVVPQSSIKIIELQTMILARSLCSWGEVVDAKAPGVLFTTMLLKNY